ncbi:winged helix-turn-helix transcriptional regulator [Candidatus Micrarchaeota archaeon]|nr:winged helix-turn-helix transcriptional regulator [Candidatus Micrarchaeota archaeon]
MDSKTRLLYWLLAATKGGPTRARILKTLKTKPMNLRQLSIEVKLDYKTVQGHIEMLMENGLLYTPKAGYGSVYFISPEWEGCIDEFLKGEPDGKKGKNKKAK